MRKIAAGMFVSLDGVHEAPENWTFDYFTDEVGDAIMSSMAAADTLLLGRKTTTPPRWWRPQPWTGSSGRTRR